MLNIRTLTLSVALVAIFVLTVGLVTARTERVSVESSAPASGSEIQEQPSDTNETYRPPSYRSQFGECFDVSLRDLAACRNTSQAAAPAEDSGVDECFDVSISELAGCRKQSQESIP